MSITSDIIRGHTESIIMSFLMDKDSYGYEINKAISETTGYAYELKEATLYGAFKRLEESGFIYSYWGDETTGARRRYYSITKQGRQAYEVNKQEWESAKTLIDKMLK